MIKVLLVEDNEKISENILEYLKNEMDIKNVYNGRDAIDYLELYNFDIIILDLITNINTIINRKKIND